jgi:O-antigen/teichoic acid export membrane protein
VIKKSFKIIFKVNVAHMPNTPDQNGHQDDKALHQTISRNIFASMLSKIYYLATRLVIPPLVLSFVSLEEYGIWSYCFILLSYLAMSVFGITNVYIRYSAIWNARQEQEKINRLLSTGIISIALLCLSLFPLIAWLLPRLFPIFNVPESLESTAYYLILGTTAIFMIHLSFGVFGYLLQGMQMIVLERTIITVSWTIETAAIILFLFLGFGIYSLLYAYIIYVLSGILLSALACYIKIPGFNLSWRKFDRHMLKKFYYFGGIVQLSGLCGIANGAMARIFAGIFMGVQTTALYEIGQKFPKMSTSVPESITSVFLPTTAHLFAHQRQEKIASIYFLSSRYLNMITGLMMGFFASFASPMITAWLGPDPKYQASAIILAWFTFPLQMDLLTGPGSAVFRSVKQPAKELLYGGVQLLLFLFAALPILNTHGGSIAMINTLYFAIVSGTSLAYLAYCNRFLGLNQWKYAMQVLIPGFAPYLIGLGIAILAEPWFAKALEQRWETLFILLVSWAVYTAAAPSLLLIFFCPKEERKQMRDLIKQIFSTKLSEKETTHVDQKQ